MCSTELVEGALVSGSVASFNNGNKVITLVLGLAATAIGTAVLPSFSRMAAEKGWNKLKKTLKFYLHLIFIVTVPIVLLICWLSEPLVHVLFKGVLLLQMILAWWPLFRRSFRSKYLFILLVLCWHDLFHL